MTPDGRAPTDDDLFKAALFNPIVAACMVMVEHGDLTREQGLIAAVLALCDANANLIEALTEASFKQRTVYIVEKPK
jgi:hypothetical protein